MSPCNPRLTSFSCGLPTSEDRSIIDAADPRLLPTNTGLSWLATSATAFVASAFTGARLVAEIGVRRILVTGLSLLALGVLWLTRVPADAN